MPLNLVTVSAAAKVLGISPQAVHKRISKGQIKATQIGTNWFIQSWDLESVRRLDEKKRAASGGN